MPKFQPGDIVVQTIPPEESDWDRGTRPLTVLRCESSFRSDTELVYFTNAKGGCAKLGHKAFRFELVDGEE